MVALHIRKRSRVCIALEQNVGEQHVRGICDPLKRVMRLGEHMVQTIRLGWKRLRSRPRGVGCTDTQGEENSMRKGRQHGGEEEEIVPRIARSQADLKDGKCPVAALRVRN